jgi:hypothetical protein
MKTNFNVYPRQNGIAYPQIYSKFRVKSKSIDVEEEEEFYIQDLTEELFDDAVDFIVEYHARGSIFHRAVNTFTSEHGVQRIREMYRKVFEEKISLICLKAHTNEIIGINACLIRSKFDEPHEPIDDAKFQLLMDSKHYIETRYNIMEQYDVDRYMFTAGLCVHKKHRCKGVATQILKARGPLMKAIGVEVTASIFSTVGAQNAASSAGFTHHYSILYEDFEKIFPEIDFSHAYGGSVKLSAFKL